MLSLTTILNVVVGLIFTWLVLSLAAMYIQEWLAARLRWRSRMLEATIRNMLIDPALADQLYNHPLIRSLFSGQDAARKPSYIPSSQFTLALFDIVMTAGTEASLIQQQLYKLRWGIDALDRNQQKAAQKRLSLILALTRRALVSEEGEATVNAALDAVRSEIKEFADDFPELKPAVEGSLSNVKVQKEQIDALLVALQGQMGAYPQELTLDRIRSGVAALSLTHPRLKQTLHALLSGVEAYALPGESVLARARQNVEEWFDNSMDRLSGWYKRRAQVLAFTLGIILAVVANADSLLLANQLWREPLLRDSLASQAEAFVNQNQDGLQPPTAGQLLLLQNQFVEINLPIGWIGTPVLLDADGAVPRLDDTTQACTLSPQAADDIYGLPVAGQCYPIVNTPRPNDLTGWILKILGLLVTGLATAQGAPFWFDVLKKIINIRSSGSNPSETHKAVG